MSWFNRGDGYFVYWLCDEYRTYYVGYTENPSRRVREHSKLKPWFSNVTMVDIRRYATKEEALKTEALDILLHREFLLNLDLNSRWADEGFADAQRGHFYNVLERYDNVPVRRFL